LDEWIYYLKNNAVADSFTAQGLEQVRERLDYDKMSPEEQRRYDREMDRLRSLDNVIFSAKIENEAQRKTIEKQEAALSVKEAVISEKDKALSEKDKALSEKDKEIAELKRLLKLEIRK
jgi:septal ring factor EnvC (AmiA/AmiB activator)